jgi:hypothetical protein
MGWLDRTRREEGYSLAELSVVLGAAMIIIIVLASAMDEVWVYYKHMNSFNKVDNQLMVADNYLNRGIRNSNGGYYWMPVGAFGMLYMYNHGGASTMAAEGIKLSGSSSWVRVEDADLFVNAMMEGNKYVNIIGSNGTKVANLLEIDEQKNRIKLGLIGNIEYWMNRGDVVESSRRFWYAELREGKLWIEGFGNVADGIVAFDIMYVKDDQIGYGIEQIPEPADGMITCNYDANNDNKLTVADDIDGDGNLDCIKIEEMEPQKFDAIEYWILAMMPEKAVGERESATETFVVGRKIFKIKRSRYPRLLIRRVNLKGFEL